MGLKNLWKNVDFIKTFDTFFYCQMSSQCSIQNRGKDTEYYCAMGLLNSSALVVCRFHRQGNLSA